MQHLSHKSADIRSEQLSGAGKTRQYSTAPHGSGPVKLPSASFLQKYEMLEHHCPSLLHFKVCVSSRSISSLHLYLRTFDAHVMSHFSTACDAHPIFYGHEMSRAIRSLICMPLPVAAEAPRRIPSLFFLTRFVIVFCVLKPPDI